MRTIAIVNQKGGCGKTTTAINLSAIYAKRGLRTLLVDMDPQAHCAAGLGVPESRIEYSIGDALTADLDGDFDPEDLRWEVTRNLDLAPSTMRLAAMEAPGGGLHGLPDKDRRLEKLVKRIGDRYDLCLIDCPPTIGLLTFNALRAARETLIPVETGYFALNGADKQWRTIQRIIERIGRPIACHMLATMHDPQSEVGKNILSALRRRFAGQLIPVVIRLSETIREAACLGQPVVDYAPSSEAKRDFIALADWLEQHASPLHSDGGSLTCGRGEFAGHVRSLRYHAPSMPVSHESDSPRSATASDRASELVRRVQGLNRPSTPPAPPEPGPSAPEPPSSPSAPTARPQPQPPSRPDPQPQPATPAASTAVLNTSRSVAVQTETKARSAVVDISLPKPHLRSADARYVIRPPVAIDRLLPPAPRPSPPEIDRSEAETIAAPAPAAPVPGTESATRFGVKRTPRGVLFTQPATCGRSVSIAGDFNAWSPTATPLKLREDSGVFQALVDVPPGKYQYRLVIDGKWQADRYNAVSEVNRYGEPNSMLVVSETQGSA